MGEKAVEADGHAEAGHHIQHSEDREVGGRHGAVPQQHDRCEEGGEGEYHGGEVDTLLQLGHALSVPVWSRYQYAAGGGLRLTFYSSK
jgi:hypothetical protein